MFFPNAVTLSMTDNFGDKDLLGWLEEILCNAFQECEMSRKLISRLVLGEQLAYWCSYANFKRRDTNPVATTNT